MIEEDSRWEAKEDELWKGFGIPQTPPRGGFSSVHDGALREQLSLRPTFNQRGQRKPDSDIQNRLKSYLSHHKDQVLFSLAFDKVTEAEFRARPGRSAHTKRGDLFQHF